MTVVTPMAALIFHRCSSSPAGPAIAIRLVPCCTCPMQLHNAEAATWTELTVELYQKVSLATVGTASELKEPLQVQYHIFLPHLIEVKQFELLFHCQTLRPESALFILAQGVFFVRWTAKDNPSHRVSTHKTTLAQNQVATRPRNGAEGGAFVKGHQWISNFRKFHWTAFWRSLSESYTYWGSTEAGEDGTCMPAIVPICRRGLFIIPSAAW